MTVVVRQTHELAPFRRNKSVPKSKDIKDKWSSVVGLPFDFQLVWVGVIFTDV